MLFLIISWCGGLFGGRDRMELNNGIWEVVRKGWCGRRVCGSRALFKVCVYQQNGMGKSALLSWTVFRGK